MSEYNPPRVNVPIFDAELFSIENSPLGNNNQVGSTTTNLQYIRTTYPTIFVPQPAGSGSGTFPAILTLPSRGTWEILGIFIINFTQDNTTQFSVNGFSFSSTLTGAGTPFMTYQKNEIIPPPTSGSSGGLDTTYEISVSKIISVLAPTNITTSYTYLNAPEALFASGTLTATQISTSTS